MISTEKAPDPARDRPAAATPDAGAQADRRRDPARQPSPRGQQEAHQPAGALASDGDDNRARLCARRRLSMDSSGVADAGYVTRVTAR